MNWGHVMACAKGKKHIIIGELRIRTDTNIGSSLTMKRMGMKYEVGVVGSRRTVDHGTISNVSRCPWDSKSSTCCVA